MLARIRRRLQQVGIDVIRHPHGTGFGVALADSLTTVASVVDVGANTGQFALHARRLGFRGRIVSFEPASSSYRELVRAAAADGNWSAVQFAIGDDEREATLRLPNAGSNLASLLPWSPAGKRLWEAGEAAETVRVTTLDKALAAVEPPRPFFLKIDTQGFDRRVLVGAEQTLGGVRALLVELAVQPLYQGAGDWLEMLAWLRDRGFSPRWFEPVVFVDGAPAEIDCLLVRLDPASDVRTTTSTRSRGPSSRP